MKKITAHKCEYCGHIVESYSGMWKHEKKCFHNPASKSCITCKSLDQCKPILNGKLITEHEFLIYQFKVPNTYYEVSDDYDWEYVLNDEFKYLEDVEIERFCEQQTELLKKLRTNCNYHSEK